MSSPSSPTARSWPEAWQLSAQVAKLTYSDPNAWVDSDMTYLGYSRGALAYASKLGNPSVAQNLQWATSQLLSRGWPLPYKWRVGAGI